MAARAASGSVANDGDNDVACSTRAGAEPAMDHSQQEARGVQSAEAPGCSVPEEDVDINALPCTQFIWTARLPGTGQRPEPAKVELRTPTSSSLEFYEEHNDDPDLFNVSLIADLADPSSTVPVAAVDLANNSAWFKSCLDNRGAMAAGGCLGAMVLPCAIPAPLLRIMVHALYAGSIVLDADNVEAIYRAADATQVRRAYACARAPSVHLGSPLGGAVLHAAPQRMWERPWRGGGHACEHVLACMMQPCAWSSRHSALLAWSKQYTGACTARMRAHISVVQAAAAAAHQQPLTPAPH